MAETRAGDAAIVLIALGACAVVPAAGVHVNDNSAMYLEQAGSLLRGSGVGLAFEGLSARGPIFPGMLALGFLVFGKSVWSALLVVRIWYTLTVVLAALWTRAMYGSWAGAIAGALVLTSNGLALVAGQIDTDIILPGVACGALWLVWRGFERPSRWRIALAGFALAAAVLTKESAVTLFAVPVFAPWLSRTGPIAGAWRAAAGMILVAGGVLFAWIVQITLVYGSPAAALGILHPGMQQQIATVAGASSPITYWARLLTIGAPVALWSYVTAHLTRVSPLAWLLAAAWVLLFIRAVRHRASADVFILAALLGFMPVALRIGDVPAVRLGQTTMLQVFTYVALAGVMSRPREAMGIVARWPAMGTVTLFALVPVQLFAAAGTTPSTWHIWRSGAENLYPVRWQSEFKVSGRFTDDQRDVIAWLSSVAAGRGPIAADGYSLEATQFFLTRPETILSLGPLRSIQVWARPRPEDLPAEQPIAVMSYTNFADGRTWYRELFLLFERDFLGWVRSAAPRYLVVSARGLYLAYYLDRAPWARLDRVAGSVRVYGIDLSALGPVPPEVDPPALHVRSGDGTRGQFALSDAYSRYELIGTLREKGNLHLFLDREGTVDVDDVQFSVRRGGRWQNLLAPEDTGFEAEGHWSPSGNQSAQRTEGAGYSGRFALRIEAADEGGAKGTVSLTNPFYEYLGGENRLTFMARARRQRWFCTNEAIGDHLVWLRRTHPDEFQHLTGLLAHMGLNQDRLAKSPCRLPDGHTP